MSRAYEGSPKRTLAAGAATVLLVLVALPVAAGPRVAAPHAGTGLVPGEVVEVVWDRVEGPVEELELLLILDGAGRETVRLTRSLPPTTTSWRWRVPAIPARAARLVLRVGRDGREVEGEPGPPFRIRATGAPCAPVTWRRGELWLGGTGGEPPVRPGGLAPRAAASWPAGRAGHAVETGPRAVAAPRPRPEVGTTALETRTAPTLPDGPGRTQAGLPLLE